MTIRPLVSSSHVAIIVPPPLKCFCFASVSTSMLQFYLQCYSVSRSPLLNINAVYANGLTQTKVDQAPPLNVNPLLHLHTLKCQIPPQIIAGACVQARPVPPEQQHRNNVAAPYA